MSYFREMGLVEHNIHFGREGFDALDDWISSYGPSRVFVLVDSNTKECLPLLIEQLVSIPADYEILEVDPGEESKSLEVAAQLWSVMLEYGADRRSLLINLGGGVVCDLGAFIASTFKRGIACVQVPTSLLAMADASVGGKNGINFAGLKNQIGTFRKPDVVIIDDYFLPTLPAEEWESGHGEMIKHSLISGKDWPIVLALQPGKVGLFELKTTVSVKLEVVESDFEESGRRKVLNLGHTFGHAWESLQLKKGEPVPHGRAVIQGLHLSLLLSDLQTEHKMLSRIYPWTHVEKGDLDALWELQLGDKKNENGEVKFVLLRAVGNPFWDAQVDRSNWEAAINLLNTHG